VSEAAYLNELSGDADVSLWQRAEENPPGACCEECLAWDWKLVEASQWQAIWRCRNCENRITQEAE